MPGDIWASDEVELPTNAIFVYKARWPLSVQCRFQMHLSSGLTRPAACSAVHCSPAGRALERENLADGKQPGTPVVG